MQNKNFLYAIVLSMGFLFIWSMFIMPKYMPKPVVNPDAVGKLPTKDVAIPSGEIQAAHRDAKTATPADDTILRDQDNEIVLTPKGGAVRHWRLKQKGQEIDLVHSPDVEPLPLATFPDAIYSIQLQGNGAVMHTTLPNGVRVTKTLTLSQSGFLQNLTITLDNPSSKPVEIKDLAWGWGPGLGTAETEHKDNARLTRAITMGKLKTHVVKPGTYEEFGAWSAIDNRYFLIAFLPVSTDKPQFNVTGTKDQTVVQVQHVVSVPAYGKHTLQYQLYAGPKGYTQLSHYNKGLENAVDFGFFSPLGKLILRAVYWLQGHLGNYGWAIIFLTVGLQILLLPLTIKSTKAMLSMKRLQPQIAELQKNYKSDPKRLNIEMMNLYKKSGTNPFGGCLPMVMQLPIFWALFTTIRNAYELRGAPFIGWIHDLSAPDTIHIFSANIHLLPIIMGAGMFFQQRMSGASSDPTQKQMAMMMPIMFTFMFYSFPAGLVLYWLTNSVMTMLIQYVLMKRSGQKIEVHLMGAGD